VLPDQASVSLSIFDAAGTCVRHLLRNQPLAAGTQTLAWDATNDAGRRVSLGNYHYLLEYSAASAQRVVGKLVVSKEKQP